MFELVGNEDPQKIVVMPVQLDFTTFGVSGNVLSTSHALPVLRYNSFTSYSYVY